MRQVNDCGRTIESKTTVSEVNSSSINSSRGRWRAASREQFCGGWGGVEENSCTNPSHSARNKHKNSRVTPGATGNSLILALSCRPPALHGMAWHGVAWPGLAWQGKEGREGR